MNRGGHYPENSQRAEGCVDDVDGHPSPKPTDVFPVHGSTPDTGNLVLCATCVKGQIWILPGVHMRKLLLSAVTTL